MGPQKAYKLFAEKHEHTCESGSGLPNTVEVNNTESNSAKDECMCNIVCGQR